MDDVCDDLYNKQRPKDCQLLDKPLLMPSESKLNPLEELNCVGLCPSARARVLTAERPSVRPFVHSPLSLASVASQLMLVLAPLLRIPSPASSWRGAPKQ